MDDRRRSHPCGHAISRRDFLAGTAATALSLPLAACAPLFAPSDRPVVALAHARTYDPAAVRRAMRDMFDLLGGVRDIVGRGDRVVVKTNLTGGTHFRPPRGYSSTESFVTHPGVVRAVCELLRDAGARELFIVEAVYDRESYPLFGYEEVARDLGATLVDLNYPAPYTEFAFAPVGRNADGVYGGFTCNRLMLDVDAFVSVSKLKCHYNAGVTHSMKNLVGIVPAAHYALRPDHLWRSALHGSRDETGTRLPRVIVDLNRARPVHLAVVDGVMTAEGGEVPRAGDTFAPVQPGVLAAGKNAVATDAVATAVMGFDPEAGFPSTPFTRGENHLALARAAGLGTNRLADIRVVGPSITDLVHPFRPA